MLRATSTICGSSRMRVYERSESAGFEERSGDVVREVPEAEGGTAKVLQPAVDGLRWAVARSGAVEEREDWGVTLLVDGRYQEGTTGRDVYESQEVH